MKTATNQNKEIYCEWTKMSFGEAGVSVESLISNMITLQHIYIYASYNSYNSACV